jgi:hypothetical protein
MATKVLCSAYHASLLLLGSVWASCASGQLATIPSPPGFEQPGSAGIAYAGYQLGFRAEAGLVPTSNIRMDPSEEADTKRIFALSAMANSDWKKHNLSAELDYFVQDAFDSAYEAQDNHTLSGSLRTRVELGNNMIFRGALARQSTIIGNNHVDRFNGFINGTAINDSLTSGFEWDNQTWFVSGMGNYVDVLNETDNLDLDQLLSQSLDRQEWQFTLQVGKHMPWGNAYVFIGDQGIDYTSSGMGEMPNRDSDGWRVGTGAQWTSGKLNGSASAIAFRQVFDTNEIRALDAVVGTLQVSYQLRPELSLATLVQRSFAETNIEGYAGLFTHTYFIGMVYAASEKLYLKLGPSINRSQVSNASMATTRSALEFSAGWQINPSVEWFFGVTLTDQSANDPALASQQYAEHTAKISLVLTR